jgi:GTPase SAR1 family protein
MYFKGSDGALLVYAADDPQSLSELAYYHEQLALHAPLCRVYLVATKCDL